MAELDNTGASISVDVESLPEGALIHISGELDISNVEVLDRAITAAIGSDGVELLAFDVGHLDFMDSSGIASFLRAASHGPRIELRNPSRLVREIVQATGLQEILHLEGES